MNLAELESRLQKLEDAEAIRQLKSRYFFACDRKEPQIVRSCFADGAVEIDYGAVGRFDNADALVALYTEVGCHDYMVEMHHGANAQIEVHDGERASGRWSLHYFLINTKTRTCTQLGGQYEDEYRKIGGQWKISRTRFVATSTLVLDINEALAKIVFAGRVPGG